MQNAQFRINLTAPNFTYTLEKQTDDLRSLILAKRANSLLSVTYQVIFEKVKAFVAVGHVPLAPLKTNAKAKNYHAETSQFSGSFITTVSINSLYPSVSGYATINNKVQQCYYGYINNSPYTMIGLNYESSAYNPMRDLFTVLILEQVRFNTLKLFNKYFKFNQSLKAEGLFTILWRNFKASYKSWDQKWQSQYIDVVNKQQLKVDENNLVFLKAFLVEKLLLKTQI